MSSLGIFETTDMATLISLFSVVLVLKYVRRVFWSELSVFPGPYFAAATKLYEAYHAIIKDDWLDNLEGLHKKYGPVIRIGPNELHFADHEFCLEYHGQPNLSKCDNYYGLVGYLLGGLASPRSHQERKMKIQPLFTGNTLAGFSSTTLNDHIDTLHKRLLGNASSRVPVNLTHYLWAYTNDVMSSYILGDSLGHLEASDLATVHDSTRAFGAIDLATVLRSIPPLKRLFDVLPSLRRSSPLGWIDQSIEPSVKDIAEGKEKRHGGVLGQLWRELGDQRMVTHEAAQALFIGNESLLSNLTCLLHLLIQNPEFIQKLRRELDTLDIGTYGSEVWRDPGVMRLGYLDAICRESTRLGPPGWHRQPRQSQKPLNYNGTVIPPKTSMSFTLRMLQRDPVLFPEPETFNPDRWLGNDPQTRKLRSSSATFGTGTRTCLGQYISQHVLRKTLVALVYNFDFALWDAENDIREGYMYMNTYPRKAHAGFFNVRLTPRFGVSL